MFSLSEVWVNSLHQPSRERRRRRRVRNYVVRWLTTLLSYCPEVFPLRLSFLFDNSQHARNRAVVADVSVPLLFFLLIHCRSKLSLIPLSAPTHLLLNLLSKTSQLFFLSPLLAHLTASALIGSSLAHRFLRSLSFCYLGTMAAPLYLARLDFSLRHLNTLDFRQRSELL